MRRPRYSAESQRLARLVAAKALANLRAGHAGGACKFRCVVHSAEYDSPAIMASNARWYIAEGKLDRRYIPQIIFDFAKEA
jgi:hypothetical protein